MKELVCFINDLIRSEIHRNRVRRNSKIIVKQYRFPVLGTQIRKEHHEY